MLLSYKQGFGIRTLSCFSSHHSVSLLLLSSLVLLLICLLCIHHSRASVGMCVYICFRRLSDFVRVYNMSIYDIYMCVCVYVCACARACTLPVSLHHCHHRPMGKPPPIHFLILSSRCSVCMRASMCVCVRVFACADVNKTGLADRLDGLVLVCAQG